MHPLRVSGRAGDLRCAVCGLPPEDAALAPRAAVQIVRCRDCNAAVAYDVKAQAPRCAFCGAEVALERVENPPEQVQEVVPFRVSPDRAEALMRQWLSTRGFFAPSKLAQEATLASLQRISWAGWLFDATAKVSWAADSDAGNLRSRWAPHSGVTSMRMNQVLVSGSRGLTEEECRALAPFYDLSVTVPPGARDQGPIEAFDLDRASARDLLTRAIRGYAEQTVRPLVPGSAIRHLRFELLLEGLATRRLALPAYVLAYRYRKKVYRLIIHGQREDCLVGQAPRSVWKRLGVALGVSLLIAGALWLAVTWLTPR